MTSCYEETAVDAVRNRALANDATSGAPSVSAVLRRDSPVEVIFIRGSRKPYFLLEFRYPTSAELEKRLVRDTGGEENNEEVNLAGNGCAEPETVEAPHRIEEAELRLFSQRLLELGAAAARGGGSLLWNGQPVVITPALAGMTVSSERQKRELRDAQAKAERDAQKRQRDEGDATRESSRTQSDKGGSAATSSFVPRSVRVRR